MRIAAPIMLVLALAVTGSRAARAEITARTAAGQSCAREIDMVARSERKPGTS